MTFNEYQALAEQTAVYPKDTALIYGALGLTGEAGEVAEKIKKMIRDDNGVLTDERRQLLKKELGDVLWYLATLAREMNLSLEDVAQHNVDKLQARLKQNKLHGDGDTREEKQA